MQDYIRLDHITFKSALEFKEISNQISSKFNLGTMSFDSENMTEWSFKIIKQIEYNISKPYEDSTLKKWDDTVPTGCNVGFALCMLKDHPESNNHETFMSNLTNDCGQKLSNLFKTKTFYHRTWLGPGKNIKKFIEYSPNDV